MVARKFLGWSLANFWIAAKNLPWSWPAANPMEDCCPVNKTNEKLWTSLGARCAFVRMLSVALTLPLADVAANMKCACFFFLYMHTSSTRKSIGSNLICTSFCRTRRVVLAMILEWYWGGIWWYRAVLASMLHMYRATAAALNVLETLGFIKDSR